MKRCDLELLVRDPENFTIEVFNDGKHVRVNGLADVWPRTKRYMVRNSGQKRAKQYADYADLRKIILAEIAKRGGGERKQLTLAGIAPAGKKREIEPMTIERWKRDFA
jgi:hypothetical protein